uniref:Uncharacterized protein n=1 Tax=Ciona intestinalis TaxID=7719 RepID=H2Y3C4_CIOIN
MLSGEGGVDDVEEQRVTIRRPLPVPRDRQRRDPRERRTV